MQEKKNPSDLGERRKCHVEKVPHPHIIRIVGFSNNLKEKCFVIFMNDQTIRLFLLFYCHYHS